VESNKHTKSDNSPLLSKGSVDSSQLGGNGPISKAKKVPKPKNLYYGDSANSSQHTLKTFNNQQFSTFSKIESIISQSHSLRSGATTTGISQNASSRTNPHNIASDVVQLLKPFTAGTNAQRTRNSLG
jgi:hypothetical protein